jgi:peroxiredoxin
MRSAILALRSLLGFLPLLLLPLASPAASSDESKVSVGDVAPNFKAISSSASEFELSQNRGNVVLIDFFATWCPPCLEEMPLIEKEIWAPFRKKGLVVVAVGREHDIGEVIKFKREHRFSFQFLEDPQREIFEKYATESIPRCYLVGRDGKIAFMTMGFDPEEFELLKKKIASELRRK